MLIYIDLMRNRRQFMQIVGAGALSFPSPAATGAKPLRGIFPIAQSPFTESDKLDVDCLVQQARFLDRGRVHGCVWPQIASEWFTLSEAERLAGAEALCSVGKKLRPAIVIGVQAADTATAVKYATHAEKAGADALISLPPGGADAAHWLEYYKTVGNATSLPLFAQAVGDVSVDQLIAWHKAVPALRYVKDEAGQPRTHRAAAREERRLAQDLHRHAWPDDDRGDDARLLRQHAGFRFRRYLRFGMGLVA
jgi:dihydrodipicolinate synthase/N-acetylneuraminate lyase